MTGLLVKELVLTENTHRPEKDCLQGFEDVDVKSAVADKEKYRKNSQVKKAGDDIRGKEFEKDGFVAHFYLARSLNILKQITSLSFFHKAYTLIRYGLIIFWPVLVMEVILSLALVILEWYLQTPPEQVPKRRVLVLVSPKIIEPPAP